MKKLLTLLLALTLVLTSIAPAYADDGDVPTINGEKIYSLYDLRKDHKAFADFPNNKKRFQELFQVYDKYILSHRDIKRHGNINITHPITTTNKSSYQFRKDGLYIYFP